MNPFRWSFRTQFLLGFLACVGLIGYAIWTQLHDGLQPCNLCILQRLAFAALGLVLLVGGLHAPRGPKARRGYGIAALLVSVVGIWIAARHVWIQSLPADDMVSCGAPLGFLGESVGWLEAVRQVMTATGSCGTIDWTFLGLTMPGWSLVWFVLLAAWAIYAAWKPRPLQR
ncbi:disulfide bond formation protein B [Pseudoxanthomonas kalamensis DSM 18571]|uniref:disulfide bond formation protein B n=1 Tax=Pseudoxanthomonas kalamensis TaxID=289483 RepID=UPI001391D47B|nr:disulfide bond formation protein B [Pseudoxanthomonas kalamensis]KAF1709485.1 disulfide bond formation protein B [Pseudoxanthomonas kalamensis DSM 18571]